MAYNIKYRIPFVDVNDLPYVIEISSEDASGNPVELIPGEDPIVVSYKDDDNIYNPLRFAAATITILVEAPMFDLYVTQPLQYKVDLKQENKLKYTGFITPEVFSQDYNGYLTQFQIESISALAVLEYFKMDLDSLSGANRLDFIKGKNEYGILNMAFEKIPESYEAIYFPKIFGEESSYSMTNYWMLAQNFRDDDGEVWTFKEFLEEFCKFWGWTLTEKDGEVYFLDLDYMKSYTSWFKYNGTLSVVGSDSFSPDLQLLSEKESTGPGNEISIVPAYSKVTIKDSDYEFKAEFPQLKNLKAYDNHSPVLRNNLFRSSRDKSSYRKNRYQAWNFYRYYDWNDKITLYLYDGSGNPINYPDSFDVVDSYMGTRIERHQRFDDSNRGKVEWEYGPVYVFKNFMNAADSTGEYRKDKIQNTGGDSLLLTGSTNPQQIGRKCLSVRTDPVVMGNTILQINFEAATTKEVYGALSDKKLWRNDAYKHVSTDKKFYTFASFRIGDYYWTGNQWKKGEAQFRIDFSVAEDDHTSTGEFRKILPGQTNIREGGFEGGYIIPVRAKEGFPNIVFGDIELTLYYPRYQWKTGDSDRHYGSTFTFIKNLKLTVSAEEEDQYLEAKQDTLYTATNQDCDYINEYEDIELKITTQKQTEPVKSYSRVFTDSLPVENIRHSGIPASGPIKETDRPENHLLAKYLNQYSEPRKKLTQDTTADFVPCQFIEDSTFPGMKFFITGEEISYKGNTSSLTMEQVL
ncbi:MAG: hypothetical protein LUG51_07650 [Tannerellaceae bacterium]|nr:hypothetical protein [Tannerellaceae bacterium]